jgi:hypothetical protein
MDARCGGQYGGYCPQLTNQTWDVANACTQKQRVVEQTDGCNGVINSKIDGFLLTMITHRARTTPRKSFSPLDQAYRGHTCCIIRCTMRVIMLIPTSSQILHVSIF